MIQLILHLLGDYVTQSTWMAENKTKAFWPAFVHALVYSLPFAMIASTAAWWVIFVTHFFIDRYRPARYVVWFKNVILGPVLGEWIDFFDQKGPRPERHSWANCSTTGYPSDVPPWLATWLLIATDNTLHLAINAAALDWL
jgi:hypothetical protein